METDAKDAAKPASRKDEEGSGSSKEQGSGSSDGHVEMVEADLVKLLREVKIEYAVYQANCSSRGAHGLAQALFKAFPTLQERFCALRLLKRSSSWLTHAHPTPSRPTSTSTAPRPTPGTSG